MRKVMFAMLAVLFTAVMACADDVISHNLADLPAAARETVNKHFKSSKLAYIKIEKEAAGTSYEVKFGDGTEIDFDSGGSWTEVDCGGKAVPQALVPQAIRTKVAETFNKKIVKIEKKKGGRYEVELEDGSEMEFDKKLNVRKIDW